MLRPEPAVLPTNSQATNTGVAMGLVAHHTKRCTQYNAWSPTWRHKYDEDVDGYDAGDDDNAYDGQDDDHVG